MSKPIHKMTDDELIQQLAIYLGRLHAKNKLWESELIAHAGDRLGKRASSAREAIAELIAERASNAALRQQVGEMGEVIIELIVADACSEEEKKAIDHAGRIIDRLVEQGIRRPITIDLLLSKHPAPATTDGKEQTVPEKLNPYLKENMTRDDIDAAIQYHRDHNLPGWEPYSGEEPYEDYEARMETKDKKDSLATHPPRTPHDHPHP